jgi:hypothetical protein
VSLLAGCASARKEAAEGIGSPIGQAVTRPASDLNLVRKTQPASVAAAYADPYRPPAEPACPNAAEEVRALDAALGDDLDAPAWKKSVESEKVGDIARDALGDLVGLPFRGVVRRVSGAEQRDRIARAMVLSGVARRAFLKGVAQARGCPISPPPAGGSVLPKP